MVCEKEVLNSSENPLGGRSEMKRGLQKTSVLCSSFPSVDTISVSTLKPSE